MNTRRQRFPQFRAGRWRRFRTWIYLGALGAAAAVLGAAAAANAQVPPLRWQLLGMIPAAGRSAQALVLDPQSGVLYAGMQRGLFVSRDGGAHWDPLEVSATPISFSSLAFDARQSALFSTDGHNLFRLAEGNWQVFTVSAAGEARTLSAEGQRAVWGLAVDNQHDALYVGSLQEFLRSEDAGATWEWESSLPTQADVLALDEGQGDVFVASLAKDELYRSHDGGRTWASLARDSVAIPLAYLSEWDQWGAMGHWIDGSLFWTAENMQGLWALPRVVVDAQNCTVRPPAGHQAQLLCAWGLMAVRSDLQTMPLPWLGLRLWVWQGTTWLAGNAGAAQVGATIAVGLALAAVAGWTYAKVSRPWGVPLWAAWFARAGVERRARPGALDAAWPAWQKQVRAELAAYDDVRPVDLVDIPATFRAYALQRYGEEVAPQEWLEASRGRLRVRPQARTGAWREVAHAAHAAHGAPGGAAEVDGQAGGAADARAQALAEALRVNSAAAQVLPGARIYLTESLALPGTAPAHLQLMFLEAAWVETFRALVNVQQRNPDDLALLVLPPDAAETAELYQALIRSLRSGSFIVLGGDEVARLLLAREPRQVLAQLRQEQV